MANYFVAASGSNTAPYDTWAKAATSLQTALTAATTDWDVIAIQYDGLPSTDGARTTDGTYTVSANCLIISSTNSGTSTITPTAMDGTTNFIGASGTSVGLTIAGGKIVFMYGIVLRNGGTLSKNIAIAGNDGAHYECESCKFLLGTTGSTSKTIFGPAGTAANAYVKLKDCSVKFGATQQGMQCCAETEIIDLVIEAGGSTPTTLFQASSSSQGDTTIIGSDLSSYTSTTLVGNINTSSHTYSFIGCKLPTSFTALASQTTVPNKGSGSVRILDSSTGGEHYKFAYYDAFGEITCLPDIYCNDGATYDGTNHYSWKIITTGNCTYYTPFVTPWIEKRKVAGAAITPYLEILRDGSTTAYQDNQVWAEFALKTTTGSTLYEIFGDRMALLGSAANQDTGVGVSGWTGDAASAWSGKLVATASKTPQALGTLAARVCVGEPSITVYVDPTIRV